MSRSSHFRDLLTSNGEEATHLSNSSYVMALQDGKRQIRRLLLFHRVDPDRLDEDGQDSPQCKERSVKREISTAV